jgi:hypothetical protein
LTVNSTAECDGSMLQVPCGMEVTVAVLIEDSLR